MPQNVWQSQEQEGNSAIDVVTGLPCVSFTLLPLTVIGLGGPREPRYAVDL